jgi:hypothetical protein
MIKQLHTKAINFGEGEMNEPVNVSGCINCEKEEKLVDQIPESLTK